VLIGGNRSREKQCTFDETGGSQQLESVLVITEIRSFISKI